MKIREENLNIVFICILSIVGILFPTSFSGVITDSTYFLVYALFFVPFLFIRKKFDKNTILCFILINLSLLVYTAFASAFFYDFSYGVYLNFLFLSLLFFLSFRNFQNLKKLKWLTRVLILLSLILIVLGFGVIYDNIIVKSFILNFYSASYDDLVPNMLARNKPIGSFGTHSVAGYFSFLFLYLNFKTYKVLNKKINLILAFLFLVILFNLNSNTSYAFFVISVFLMINGIAKAKYKAIVYAVSISSLVFITMSLDFSEMGVFDVVQSDKNGLTGRYSGETPLKDTFKFIEKNPFLAIGLTKPKELYFSDSGFILYFLRGSVFLLVGVYLGFFIFLKKNMYDYKILMFVFLITMAFEIGYPLLLHIRFLCFIPFVIVYLNYLKLAQDDKN